MNDKKLNKCGSLKPNRSLTLLTFDLSKRSLKSVLAISNSSTICRILKIKHSSLISCFKIIVGTEFIILTNCIFCWPRIRYIRSIPHTHESRQMKIRK